MAAQVKHVLLVVVDQPSRRPDEHVDTALQSLALLVVIGAAIGKPEGEAGVLSEHERIGVNLHGELSCRREHDCPRLRVGPDSRDG